jgi:hypothetical protein
MLAEKDGRYMSRISLLVNGAVHAVDVDPQTPLLYVLSDELHLRGPKFNRSDVEAMGAGETAITVTAAALGNAIFDATGARLRQVPFTPARVKAALDAKS